MCVRDQGTSMYAGNIDCLLLINFISHHLGEKKCLWMYEAVVLLPYLLFNICVLEPQMGK